MSNDRSSGSAGVPAPSRPSSVEVEVAPRVAVEPIGSPESFKSRAYAASRMPSSRWSLSSCEDIRLHERRLASIPASAHAGARGHGAARTRRLRGAVPRRGSTSCARPERGDRDDHRLGGAWRAWRRVLSPRSERGGDRLAAPAPSSERQAARQARRIFRGEHRVSSNHHPHEPQQRPISLAEICLRICA